MIRETLIQKTIRTLNVLPAEKAGQVADFANYILKKHEEYALVKESEMNSMSLAYGEYSFKKDWNLGDKEENVYWNAFQFLKDEEVLYTAEDIKEKY